MIDNSNKERFLALLETHKKILFKVAHAYCKRVEDRNDLIQDMVIELWQAFGKFDNRAQFSTWMYRVSMNVAISFHRSESRRIRDALPIDSLAIDLVAIDSNDVGESDSMRMLQQLIREMDELNRALVMLFLDGLSYDEIAGVMGISATNVSTRISRIKQKLQQDFSAA